jgi:hypothetical protein
MSTRRQRGPIARPTSGFFAALATLAVGGSLCATIFTMTLADFHVPGSQVGDLSTDTFLLSVDCSYCHAAFKPVSEPTMPYDAWKGSLMAQGGRDPLFFAQMTTAEQDVTSVGYYCLRCHVPYAVVSGHANVTDGSTIDDFDREGVTCHFCHSMVDPIYKPGISPIEDEAILAAIPDLPDHYGNAMFVLDPAGQRRGPRTDTIPAHEVIYSPFHKSSSLCGTCHDVGNVATTKQPDGSYRYNAIDEPSPTDNPWQQFPLERTYTEWKLSEFAATGVDMGGRFGGAGVTIVSTCQDCHMPRVESQACNFGPVRPDVARHDFAGAAVGVLEMIKQLHPNDPAVDPVAIDTAKSRSIDMLQRAATLELTQVGAALKVRVINEGGHKLPTGHIEGRRAWVHVQMFDASGAVTAEYGHYDDVEAELDEYSTEVYEMLVGLSEEAAKLTGLPAGLTGHMSLADTIVKDNRIPPRGFNNATFAAGGAPTVAHSYADGQYWDDTWFAIPNGTTSVEAEVYYQNLPRHYIEHLRDANVTNHWGDTLYSLWNTSGRGEPIAMDSDSMKVVEARQGDLDLDGDVDASDLGILLGAWGSPDHPADLALPRGVAAEDLAVLLGAWGP